MAAFNPQIAATRNPFAPSAPVPPRPVPAGTFVPGTKVQVGSHRVVIEKYLSEGGFAHVYVVRLPKPVDGVELAVLKRVAVPDKEHLANMRTEVDTMKRLRGQKPIVKYIDSHASQLKGGGYEVFLLMEYCAGGGLIDFMNTRLQNRLTEPEILKIFSDVAEGVACMHYLRPPLLHRDLKVENVLISSTGSVRTYKVCDFGSAAPPRPAATTAAEGRLIEDDIQRHTTLQYRSPEMIDVYRNQPIDEKADIWALGVLLYKLCYYTTPFEEAGQMAILNARFKYPAHPVFSDQLKLLIASMLREQPSQRPNIYQVLQKACQMQGKEVPIRDIYSSRSQSEGRKQLSAGPPEASARVGAMLSPPTQEMQPTIPDIAPMRRGRPTKPVSHHGSAKPSPSPLRIIDGSDPFASLDGGMPLPSDDLSSRFPTLEQFSLLTDKRQKFDFDPPADEKKSTKDDSKLSERVTNALADEAFARPPSPGVSRPSKTAPPHSTAVQTVLERKKSAEKKLDLPGSHTNLPSSLPPKSPMSPMVPNAAAAAAPPPPTFTSISNKPIYRFPPSKAPHRPASEPWDEERSRAASSLASSGSRLAHLLDLDASQYHHAPDRTPKSPASSRPSLEGSRPSMMDLEENTLTRSRSANVRVRPASVHIGSRLDNPSVRGRLQATLPIDDPEAAAIESDTNIMSDVDFLRAKEEEDKVWKHQKRLSSGSRHGKRSSLPSISLSGTKNLLSGRFGDAFRKFEGGNHSSRQRSESPSPSTQHINSLTPIDGSVATDLSDDRHEFDEIEDVSPEMRRELEKRKLEAEERRVATAAAEYRKRIAERGGEGGRERATASSIQNKVQSLLKENEKPPTKTAAGYGRFTDRTPASQTKSFESPSAVQLPKPSVTPREGEHGSKSISAPSSAITPLPNYSASQGTQRPAQRPTAPPKPQVLRTGQGIALSGNSATDSVQAGEAVSPNDDWEANFSKRYPSLSGLELVETEIDSRKKVSLRTREV
jgi:AP2-associated kinase